MLLPLLLLAACAVEDPPPLCDDGPHEATECGLHEDLGEDWDFLRLQNEAEGVDALLVREIVGYGPGRTNQYALRGFALVKDGCLFCLDDADALSYTNGHHNWDDDAEASSGGVLHRCRLQYLPEDPDDLTSDWIWSYDLTGLDPESQDTLWGPIALELTHPDPW